MNLVEIADISHILRSRTQARHGLHSDGIPPDPPPPLGGQVLQDFAIPLGDDGRDDDGPCTATVHEGRVQMAVWHT